MCISEQICAYVCAWTYTYEDTVNPRGVYDSLNLYIWILKYMYNFMCVYIYEYVSGHVCAYIYICVFIYWVLEVFIISGYV